MPRSRGSSPAQVTATPAPTPGPSAPATVPRAEPPVVRPPAREYPTPRLLRILLVLSVLAVLLFTVLSAGQLQDARATMGEAAGHVNQLDRVEEIRTQLLRADASAQQMLTEPAPDGSPTSETPETDRPAYRDALARTRVLLIEAAGAQSADRDQLAAVNRDLDEYAALLESARPGASPESAGPGASPEPAGPGQGAPEGQAALTEAGRHLATVILPVVSDLVTANSARVGETERVFALPLIWITGILALGVLTLTAIVTMIRFKRVLNLGLAGALALIAVALVTATGTITGVQSETQAATRSDMLLGPRKDMAFAAMGIVLLGLAAIGCTIAGLRPRLREYT